MASRYDDLQRPPLSAERLARELVRDSSRWTEVEVVYEVASTNAVLADRARAGADDGVVLIAEHQAAGRGRLDRTWSSPPRAGITMSVLVRPGAVPVARWSWIPLLTGLAVAAALRTVTGVAAGLKWPNDVVVDDRKLAGILVERVESDHGAAAVIGMGINVSTRADELPTTGATSLVIEGAVKADRATVLKAVLRRLDGLLDSWESAAGDPSRGLRSAYESACTTLGRSVAVAVSGDSTFAGEAVGIDDSGRLVVATAEEQRVFGAGDVLHVRRSA
jgi:BirA family biotin operon repressor/biotin-[acetyl-CoA-carboxylase] ligase